MKTLKDEWIVSSDGTRICADVYLPDADGPFPALYAVSPYQKDLAYLPAVSAFRFRETGPIEWWVEECGYAYVLADQRGTGKSGGTFGLFSPAEQQDYCETIEWIAVQSWSSGKVAMVGESGFSVNQWLAAAARPPHLTCALIYNAFTDLYRDAMYHGGVFSMGFLNFWVADNIRASATDGGGIAARSGGVDCDILGLTLNHPVDSQFWRDRSPRVADIEVPTLVIAWWYNIGLHLRGTLTGYEDLTSPKRLVALAGTDSAERNFKTEFLTQHLKPWYDHWLKDDDNGVMDTAPVRIDVQNGQSLRDEQTWPLERAVATKFFLDPQKSGAVTSLNDGSLRHEPPAAGTPATPYSYPNPEWTVGTTIVDNGIPQPVRGILTFTSEPLEEDLEVTGPIAAVLYVESDQTDTEFQIKISEQLHVPKLKEVVMDHLAHVPPPSTMVTRGWLRASHRALDAARSTELAPYHSHLEPTPIEPGTIIRYDIEVWATSYLFRKGNRIRIEIANGDSTIADGLFSHYYGHKYGRDLYYHDAEHPSHVVLPIVAPE
jgi:predicted acyl esterase